MTLSSSFSGKRILITGGLGFIGSNLAHRLADSGAEITLADSMIPEYGGNLFNLEGIRDKVLVNFSDIRDEHSVRHLVHGQDYLFNLAGQTSHMDSMLNPFTDLEINSKAQLSILEACRKHNPEIKIIFASTRQIYGRPVYLPVDERHPIAPVDVNGINKTSGERYHRLYNEVYGLRSCVLRLTNTIGPRMRVKDTRQTFLGHWIRLLAEGKPFEVWGGQQLRDFTYVEDAVDAFLLAALREEGNGQSFNLGGSGQPVSLRNLADMLVEANGGGEFIVRPFPEDRMRIDIGDYYSDYRLIEQTLGWKSATPLKEALATTLEFYRRHLDHYV